MIVPSDVMVLLYLKFCFDSTELLSKTNKEDWSDWMSMPSSPKAKSRG